MFLILMVTCFVSLHGMDNGWFSFLFRTPTPKADVENPPASIKDGPLPETTEDGISDLCQMVTQYYFTSEQVVGRESVIRHLRLRLQRSSRKGALENLFSHMRETQVFDEQSESSDTPEIADAKSELHLMVMGAVEESLNDKAKEADSYRHAMLNSQLKFRMALITAATTGITTIASSTVAIVLAFTQ